MAPVEAAWLAGFFDGEGSLSSYMAGRGKKHRSWVLSIPNTNQEALFRCWYYTNVGTVRPRRKAQGKQKAQYEWQVQSIYNIEAICHQMRPYLVVKRPVVERFLVRDLP